MIDKCICCESLNSWEYVCMLPKFIFKRNAEIYKCKECGCGVTEPKPSADEMFYINNQDYTVLFGEKRNLYIRFAKELLEFLKGEYVKTNSKLLDVACGSGALVEYAGSIGFEALGIEVNTEVVKVCRDKGLNIINEDVKNLNDEHYGKYSVIVLSAILEHLEDPFELLINLKKYLNPEGVLLISQADFTGLLPRAIPWLWYGWQPIEHYWHFSPESFTSLANRAGYEVVKSERSSLYQTWYVGFNFKEFIGKNVPYVFSKIAIILGKKDSFNMILKINNAC